MLTYHPLVAHGHKGVIQAFLKKKVSPLSVHKVPSKIPYYRKSEPHTRASRMHKSTRITLI